MRPVQFCMFDEPDRDDPFDCLWQECQIGNWSIGIHAFRIEIRLFQPCTNNRSFQHVEKLPLQVACCTFSAAHLILKIGKYDPISVSYPVQAQLSHEQLPGWSCTRVLDRALPWMAFQQVSSISEGRLRSQRFLCLRTTAVETTSCQHPISPQQTSTLHRGTWNSLHTTVHVTPLRIYVTSVHSYYYFRDCSSQIRHHAFDWWTIFNMQCFANDAPTIFRISPAVTGLKPDKTGLKTAWAWSLDQWLVNSRSISSTTAHLGAHAEIQLNL